jgi:glucuronate isomerase
MTDHYELDDAHEVTFAEAAAFLTATAAELGIAENQIDEWVVAEHIGAAHDAVADDAYDMSGETDGFRMALKVHSICHSIQERGLEATRRIAGAENPEPSARS